MTWPAHPCPFGLEILFFIGRSSTSQPPSGRGEQKGTARPPPDRSWAGIVPVLLTTSRSPGSSRPGRSRKTCWLIWPEPRRLTSSRTPSRATPRASGGSCASRSAGSRKSGSPEPVSIASASPRSDWAAPGGATSVTIGSPGPLASMAGAVAGRHQVGGAVPAAWQPLRDEPDERGDHRLGPRPVRDVLAGEGPLVHVGAQVARVGPPDADRELLGRQHVRRLLQCGLGGAEATPARVRLHGRVRGDVEHGAAVRAQQRQQLLGQRDGRDDVYTDSGPRRTPPARP